MRDVLTVAGSIAEKSGWTLSNLSLQKLVYLAQLLHLGETGTPFFPEDFEAWDYGPVVPNLYHDLKMFGAGAVAPYSSLRPARDLASKEAQIVNSMANLGSTAKPGQLVSMTHWKDGAWAKVYSKHIRGLTIPKSLIRAEYDARARATI